MIGEQEVEEFEEFEGIEESGGCGMGSGDLLADHGSGLLNGENFTTCDSSSMSSYCAVR